MFLSIAGEALPRDLSVTPRQRSRTGTVNDTPLTRVGGVVLDRKPERDGRNVMSISSGTDIDNPSTYVTPVVLHEGVAYVSGQ